MRSPDTFEKIDPVNRLPQELVVRIFGFLTPVELWYATQVCHSWQDIARDNWKALIDFSQEGADDKATELGSIQELFIKHPEYRKAQYRAIDQRGREWCEAQADQHFHAICENNRDHWSVREHEWYHREFETLYKDHPWIIQVLDILCRVPYCIPGTSSFANNRPNHYVKAFNYLYEHNALNETTIACINACVEDENLSNQFHIHYYAHFIVLFYRAGILNDENLIAIKTSVDPDFLCAKALEIVLDAFKGELDSGKKQQVFAIYRDRLLELARVDEFGASLEGFANCMVNLYSNGILLSSPDHRVIYDELLKLDSIRAHSYSDSYVILHKANLLIGPGCELLRCLLLENPSEQGDWRAAKILLKYISGKLRKYVRKDLKKLGVDPNTMRKEFEELEKLRVDSKTLLMAVNELENLKYHFDKINKALEAIPEGLFFEDFVDEESDTDSGRGSEDSDHVCSPYYCSLLSYEHAIETHVQLAVNKPVVVHQTNEQEFQSKLDLLENTPSPIAVQTQSDNEPLRQFKISLSKLVNQNNAARILHALQNHDAHSFETIQGFLLNECISREYFLKKNSGAAAIAELYGNKHLAFFIRIAAELDKLLYENDRSLIKHLPDDDRTQAADTYLRAVYRSEVSSAIGDYLQKTSPNKGDHKKLSKALEKATERFCHNKNPLTEGGPLVKSLAEDRTRLTKIVRVVWMVLINTALVLSIVGIAAIVYHHRKYGCTFFGATQSKQTLYHMNKKALHEVKKFSSKQANVAFAA